MRKHNRVVWPKDAVQNPEGIARYIKNEIGFFALSSFPKSDRLNKFIYEELPRFTLEKVDSKISLI